MGTRRVAYRAGFTLIELLVVIMILAILVALIIPMGAKLMEASKRNTCLNHMRAVGQTIMLYAGDNDNSLLPSLQWHSASRSSGDKAWYTYLADGNYLPKELWVDKLNGVMSCPSRTNAPYLEKDGKADFDGVHFGMNVYPGFDNTIIPGQSMYKMSKIVRPAKTLLLGESDGRYAIYPQMANRRLMIYPHDNGCNLFFADGHSEYQKKDLRVPTATDGYPFY